MTERLEDRLEADTYPMPNHGWTCFHCGETFLTPGSARDHFGHDPSADAACRIKAGDERGLVMALRKAEAEARQAASEIRRLREREGALEVEIEDLMAVIRSRAAIHQGGEAGE